MRSALIHASNAALIKCDDRTSGRTRNPVMAGHRAPLGWRLSGSGGWPQGRAGGGSGDLTGSGLASAAAGRERDIELPASSDVGPEEEQGGLIAGQRRTGAPCPGHPAYVAGGGARSPLAGWACTGNDRAESRRTRSQASRGRSAEDAACGPGRVIAEKGSSTAANTDGEGAGVDHHAARAVGGRTATGRAGDRG
ncbi:hypothetical protein D7I43_31640 [Micromonospora globbae]|uniref:Uncharacterized protein n=1 Tax=Micromonospora globbae TaxID=1894969 RepID=A0A420EJX9_9ACTN|nr:hypothetical protein D7I43_31640 [Micromonospora globbae]